MNSFLRRAALCALSGTLLFLSCADFDIWPLTWFGMLPMLWVILDEKCERPFLYGWIAGLFANGGGFYWINGLLMRFGHLPFIAAIPLYSLLIAYQALAFGAFAWILRKLRDHTSVRVTWLAPVVMTAVELVVPFVFPWYLAITQAWNPSVIQVADLTGPLGVTFLIVLTNGALYDLAVAWRSKQPLPWRRAGAAAAIVAASLVYGQVRIHQIDARRNAAPHIKVGLVQANIGINEKWEPGLAESNLATHQRLSSELEQEGAQLIVWPESSYPYPISRRQTTDFPPNDVRRIRIGFHAPLLLGALTRGGDSPYPFNSALMLDGEGRITGRFDKNFLLVFGEYIPYYEQLRFLQQLIPEMSNFARGHDVTTFAFGDWRLGPMICYEDIIPSFGRRLVAQDPAPNLLVNITNDAWFGATSEPYEHMALAVYRAVEHRLDLVRAVNTGVSAVIDATGRVRMKSPAVDPDVTRDARPAPLLGDVAMLDASGLYGRVGDLFGVLNLLAVLWLGILALGHAERKVAWSEVGLGAVTMLGATVVGGLLAGGGLALTLSLLAHRPGADRPEELATTGALILGGAIGAIAVGVLLERRARTTPHRPRIEAATAVCLVTLLPTFLFGRTEGATASLVFATLGAVGLALLGARLAKRPAAIAAPTDKEPAAVEKAHAPAKRRKKKR